jgi:hypothetical protein
LTTGDKADREGAETEPVMDMEWEHRHRDADNQKGDEDQAHDRQQRGSGARSPDRLLHRC